MTRSTASKRETRQLSDPLLRDLRGFVVNPVILILRTEDLT